MVLLGDDPMSKKPEDSGYEIDEKIDWEQYSIQETLPLRIPYVPGSKPNATTFFGKTVPKMWEYLARLSSYRENSGKTEKLLFQLATKFSEILIGINFRTGCFFSAEIVSASLTGWESGTSFLLLFPGSHRSSQVTVTKWRTKCFEQCSKRSKHLLYKSWKIDPGF